MIPALLHNIIMTVRVQPELRECCKRENSRNIEGLDTIKLRRKGDSDIYLSVLNKQLGNEKIEIYRCTGRGRKTEFESVVGRRQIRGGKCEGNGSDDDDDVGGIDGIDDDDGVDDDDDDDDDNDVDSDRDVINEDDYDDDVVDEDEDDVIDDDDDDIGNGMIYYSEQ